MVWLRSFLIEFGPALLFFAVDYFTDFTTAVWAMIIATVLGTIFNRMMGDPVPKFAVLSTVSFMLFGLATIVTGNQQYFILSDTILDGLFALLLFGSVWLKRPLLKFLFERSFAITDCAWEILTVRWGGMFLVLAVINEIIRQSFSADAWVNFKLTTVFIILIFGCYQFTLSARERIPEESNRLGLRIKN